MLFNCDRVSFSTKMTDGKRNKYFFHPRFFFLLFFAFIIFVYGMDVAGVRPPHRSVRLPEERNRTVRSRAPNSNR